MLILDQIPAVNKSSFEEEAISLQMDNTLNDPAQSLSLQRKGSALQGVLAGLIPLALLMLIVAIILVLTALARQLFALSGFFAQQQASVIVLIAGLVVALVVYIIAIVRTMRSITFWQRSGALGQARAALLALGCTALVVLFPVVLAIVLPQNPAP
jgi:ABC-type multidrug transport system fused ATPase/permease subunit